MPNNAMMNDNRQGAAAHEVIVNIPHAGLEIPGDIPFCLPPEEVEAIARRMADLYTDELIGPAPGVRLVTARTARIVTNTERFADDAKETAAKYGQGAIYVKDYLGRPLRPTPTAEERADLLRRYYYPHHRQLNRLTAESLQKHGTAVLLDLHSYPSTYNMGSGQGNETPDICLGFETGHCKDSMLHRLTAIIEKRGYSYAHNAPFSGALVPSDYFGDPRVHSYMLEIKRALYMDEQTQIRNPEALSNLRSLLKDIIATLQRKN